MDPRSEELRNALRYTNPDDMLTDEELHSFEAGEIPLCPVVERDEDHNYGLYRIGVL
jgi:hypothetical protein